MSHDPLLDALAALDKPAPEGNLDARTQRQAEHVATRPYLRWAGLVLAVVVGLACLTYLVVVLGRASALLGRAPVGRSEVQGKHTA